MTFTEELLLYGCIALAVFFLMEAGFYFFGGNEKQSDKRIRRRLGRANISSSIQNLKRKTLEINEDDFFIDKYYSKLLLNADSEITLKRLYMVIIAVTASLTMIFFTLAPIVPFVIIVIVSLIVGFGIPTLILKRKVQKRHDKFSEQFPDAIELIVRSLRVGQPLSTAMQTVGKELPDPIGTEFELVSQEIAYGKDVPGALESMLNRITLQDLRFFIVAIQIQHESGGNLAEILDGLSKIIRGRFKLMRKVQALTAEGRFSAWFLSAFPLVMIFLMNTVNPGYYKKVSDYQYFPHLVVAIVVTLIINVVAMRIITRIKV